MAPPANANMPAPGSSESSPATAYALRDRAKRLRRLRLAVEGLRREPGSTATMAALQRQLRLCAFASPASGARPSATSSSTRGVAEEGTNRVSAGGGAALRGGEEVRELLK